jgi:hypothetical protein
MTRVTDPSTKKTAKGDGAMKFGGYLPACGLSLLIAGEAGTATAAPAADANNLSDLEQVTVYAPFSSSGDGSTSGVSLGGTTVSLAEMQRFNRDTLDVSANSATCSSRERGRRQWRERARAGHRGGRQCRWQPQEACRPRRSCGAGILPTGARVMSAKSFYGYRL